MVLFTKYIYSQTNYKNRVLDQTKIDILMNHYKQDGDHASVTGGIGTEKLKDNKSEISIKIPLNADDVLKIDAGVSAYTSASTSNINPVDQEEANLPIGSPWIASSGASKSDINKNLNVSYQHSSDSRNFVWGANLSVASEYDYSSYGFGGNTKWLFNNKNTKLGLRLHVYLDKISPIYPLEFKTIFFGGVYNSSGKLANGYSHEQFKKLSETSRNTYSISWSFSQILTSKLQTAINADFIVQQGLLSTSFHRIYFKDKKNYYIGSSNDIINYRTARNDSAFHLADDIERLPGRRFKFPISLRMNYYINDYLILRSYYRYNFDSWSLNSHTVKIDLPIQVIPSLSVGPTYRYYTQQPVEYFATYDSHLSTQEFYTSDYDLSGFDSQQYGFRAKYTDIYSTISMYNVCLHNIILRYSNYQRSDDLSAFIITLGLQFRM